jgi:hypothetical protein
MFEQDLLDEEIKKKKRRVLVVLFAFLSLGAAVTLPLAELPPPEATAVSEAAETLVPTAAGPTLAPAGTATAVLTPGVEATPTRPPEVAPEGTAAATVAPGVPTVTEGPPGGVGDGTLVASLTATGTPPGTAPAVVTPSLTATATGVPAPEVEATATISPGGVPEGAATATVAPGTPAVAEETPGGTGDETPIASPPATVTPPGTVPASVTPTPLGPSQLPASGADAGRGVGWLNLGLVAVLLGALMLAAGHALHNTGPERR